MKTAIVILNWNGRGHLEKYLPSVMQYSNMPGCEIVVADNGSTDDSMSFLEETYPNIKRIGLDKNYGFAGGYNMALKQIDADIFCLLNSDVRVTDGWVHPVLDLFKADTTIAAIQPKILSDREYNRFEHAGAAGGYVDKYGYPFCRGRIMNEIEPDNGQYNTQSDIFWASGACLFIRSEVFRKAGGFDADFFAHMEEIDLCWRLKNQGYRITYCPQSVIYHWGGATLDYNNPRKLFLNFRNSLWTLYKNYTGNNLPFRMFYRMVIDGFAVIKFFVTFDWKDMMAVLRAHAAFHRSKSKLRVKREKLMPLVVKTIHPEILPRSIVWQFFFFSRRKFSDFSRYDKMN